MVQRIGTKLAHNERNPLYGKRGIMAMTKFNYKIFKRIIINIFFIISVLLLISACDPFHSVKYNVNLRKTDVGINTLNNEESRQLIAIIEKIAYKYNMEKKIVDGIYYYFGNYESNQVRIKLAIENKDITVEITDLFRVSQSSISGKVQKEIVDTIKNNYGNEVIIELKK
jgi:hypothetical protein